MTLDGRTDKADDDERDGAGTKKSMPLVSCSRTSKFPSRLSILAGCYNLRDYSLLHLGYAAFYHGWSSC